LLKKLEKVLERKNFWFLAADQEEERKLFTDVLHPPA